MLTLADRLKHALAVRGRKPADLARELGISRASVTELLKGESKSMKAGNLLRAAAFLNVNTHWLESGRGLSGLDVPVLAVEPVAPLLAAEPPPACAWPFTTVTRDQIAALTPAGLAKLEERIQSDLEMMAGNPAFTKPAADIRKARAAA